ncbi:MAG: hypothetical protein ACRDNF_12290, partial [Streptosporangiaceae bacterium]
LWERFASLLGVDPGCVDVSRARPNVSLGLAQIEFLRRLNMTLPDEVPDWFYMWNVKEAVAHRFEAKPAGGDRLTLPADRMPWAEQQGKTLVSALGEGGYDVVGDLDELLPRPAGEPGVSPAQQSAADVLEAVVQAASALVVNQYHQAFPAAKPQTVRGLVSRVESTVASSPHLKRTVRELSSRYAAVRRLRILAWRALERSRVRKGA